MSNPSPFLLIAMLGLPWTAQATVLTAPAVSSSTPAFSGTFAAANATSGSTAEYASQGGGVNTFLEFTFAAPQTFDRVVVINRISIQSDLIADFTLTFDGGPTAAVTRTAVSGASGIHSIGGAKTATTVRLDVDTLGSGTNGNVGVMEVFFLNTPANSIAITGTTVVNSAPAFVGYGAGKAVDGIVGRDTTVPQEYASQGLGVNTFVDFDLGSLIPVTGFDFFDRLATADRTTAFAMVFSQDAEFGNADDLTRTYTNAGMVLSDEFAAINARYVRYDVTATAGANAGLSELIFYQAVPEPGAALLAALTLPVAAARRRRHV